MRLVTSRRAGSCVRCNARIMRGDTVAVVMREGVALRVCAPCGRRAAICAATAGEVRRDAVRARYATREREE